MAEYVDWDSFLNAVEEDIEESFWKISDTIIEIWKREVEDKFYGLYNPSEYIRDYQTLDSIRMLNVSKNINGQIEIEIGYDTSLIHTSTYIGKQSGLERERHSDPSMQPIYVEEGFFGYGVEREGSHALEYMLKYIKGNDFKALFANELRKLGYILK